MPSIAPEAFALPDYSDYLHVVVAVIENGRGEVLIARRHDHVHQGGLWEFPGGKVESGEAVLSALKRELVEELAIEPVNAHPLIRIPHSYPDSRVLLDVWRVTTYQGEAQGAEGQPLAWVKKDEFDGYDFPAANRPIIKAAQLPSRYLITPEPGPRAEWPIFLEQLERSLEAGVSLLQFRAITLAVESYLELSQEVVARCIRHGTRVLLNADVAALGSCNADGIHLNSRRLMACEQRPVAEEKLLAASCHTLDEIKQAEKIGVDFALLSPVKSTASHPDAEVLGWSRFQWLSEQSVIPLYALGGMSDDDLPEAWRHGAQGIAAIRALWCGPGQ